MNCRLGSSELFNLIVYCDKILARLKDHTNGILKYGAGNQLADYHRTGGESAVRTGITQTILASGNAGQDGWKKPLRNAGIALKLEAGNCSDQASVVYAVLREKLPYNYRIIYCLSTTMHHHFCVVSFLDSTTNFTYYIVVDSWPTKCQTVLLEHYFCANGSPYLEYQDQNTFQTIIRPDGSLNDKAGTNGTKGKINKALSHYTNHDGEIKTQLTRNLAVFQYEQYPQNMYDVQYCATANCLINYTL